MYIPEVMKLIGIQIAPLNLIGITGLYKIKINPNKIIISLISSINLEI